MIRIGIDTGGTFTDVIRYDERTGETWVTKTPSTPPEFHRGVLNGVDLALGRGDGRGEGGGNGEGNSDDGVGDGDDGVGDGDDRRVDEDGTVDPADVGFFTHGTTVGTNAILEGDLPEIGLVTNEGLSDVLAIGDQTRPELYDLQQERPDPPVRRRHRYGVPCRIDETGDVIEPLDEDAVGSVADSLVDAGVATAVVSTLFSYLEPAHERRIGEILADRGIDPVLSSTVHPEIREYDRTVTTALNAAVRGRVSAYLDRLSTGVADRGIDAPVNVMHSGGGLFSTDAASQLAIRTVLSGPAAGAVATREVADSEGHANAVGMDMGGTSTDVSIVRDGDLVRTVEGEIGDYPLKTPMIDVTTVGAGGGSVVAVDRGRALGVGPASAGADPGPVCYGRGGDRPTLTDANLLLGRLNPEYFLGGGMDLAVERARSVFREAVADPLDTSVEEAALAAVRVANASIARQIRRVTVERGQDPAGFALVAFGGAGPLQAAAVAREVGMDRIVIPPSPGVFSARGLLVADVRLDESRSYRGPLAPEPLGEAFDALRARLLDRLDDQGFDSDAAGIDPSADLRYEGQAYELTVPVPGDLDSAALETVRERFHDAHRGRYGHARPEDPVEAVTLRATATVPTPEMAAAETGTGGDPHRGSREVYFQKGWLEADVYRREPLEVDARIEGPAVVEGPGSTALVLPDGRAVVSPSGCLDVVADR